MTIEEHTYDEPFDMTTPEGRAAAFADQARREKTALESCTPLYAEIKKTSKYYGQTKPGALFPVLVLRTLVAPVSSQLARHKPGAGGRNLE
ncbi:MAG: hypothetical protein KGL61_05175 [Burkholderiales bacterium]|nr:hypothetical protein [Burkholderiales bacterium]MDE2608952.1 hypothetical protein [Burkholderiales bacterium]